MTHRCEGRILLRCQHASKSFCVRFTSYLEIPSTGYQPARQSVPAGLVVTKQEMTITQLSGWNVRRETSDRHRDIHAGRQTSLRLILECFGGGGEVIDQSQAGSIVFRHFFSNSPNSPEREIDRDSAVNGIPWEGVMSVRLQSLTLSLVASSSALQI